MNVRVLLPALLLGFTLPAHAVDRVSLKVSPSVAFAPATLFVRATIDANHDNRALEIVAESDDFYRSSEIALDGEHAPRVTIMQFKSLPSGLYQVRAVLRGVSGEPPAPTDARVHIVSNEE